MNTTRQEYMISREHEYHLIQQLCEGLSHNSPELNASNTLVLMVSPDYSATVAMHVAHALSYEGEMADIMAIHVPYPDQHKSLFMKMAKDELLKFFRVKPYPYDYLLLVEAAVIRGSNYEWLTGLINEMLGIPCVTASLLENIHSNYKSNVVAEYYDDELQDVTFYYERFNKHWQ